MVSKGLFQRFLSIATAVVFVGTFHLCLIGSVYADASAGSHACCEKSSSPSSKTDQKMFCCEDLDVTASLAKLTTPSLSENKFAQKSVSISSSIFDVQRVTRFAPNFYSGPPELSFTAFFITPLNSSQAPPLL